MSTFHNWLLTAPHGSSIIYFVGNLAESRGDLTVFPPRAVRTTALDDADAAWDASNAGLVNLVQRASPVIRPNGAHVAFEYIAQRTSKARPST